MLEWNIYKSIHLWCHHHGWYTHVSLCNSGWWSKIWFTIDSLKDVSYPCSSPTVHQPSRPGLLSMANRGRNSNGSQAWRLKILGRLEKLYIWWFPKIVGFPPKSSILIGFSIIIHPIWGTPIFGNTHIWVVVPNIFYVHPYLGKMIQFDEHMFQMGWFNHQLVYDRFTYASTFKSGCQLNPKGWWIDTL